MTQDFEMLVKSQEILLMKRLTNGKVKGTPHPHPRMSSPRRQDRHAAVW